MKDLDISRRGITPSIRKKILGDVGDLAWCVYCGYVATEVDHIVPRSRGGGLDDENLAPACFECNNEKSSLTPEEWAKKRLNQNKPWPIPDFCIRLDYAIRVSGISPKLDETFSEDDSYFKVWMNKNFHRLRDELMRLRNVNLEKI